MSSQEDDEWSPLPRSARLTDWTFSAKIVINIRFLLRLHYAGVWRCWHRVKLVVGKEQCSHSSPSFPTQCSAVMGNSKIINHSLLIKARLSSPKVYVLYFLVFEEVSARCCDTLHWQQWAGKVLLITGEIFSINYPD